MSVLALPVRLDLSSVTDLSKSIKAHLGADLTLDAGNVSHLGGLGLQLLASAAASFRAQGNSLTLAPRSEAFDEALALFGTSLDALQSETPE